LTWATAGISGITIGTTTANGTAGRVLYTDGALVQQYAISGTGSVAMTNTPTLVTPVLGDATATSINGIPISGDSGTSGIYMISDAGAISTSFSGGSIDTGNFGGAINTSGNGTIGLGEVANRTYLVSTAGNNEKTATFPNVNGTVAVGAHSATTTHAMFSAGAAGYTTRAIATADIATALTTPGAIGGTTASTGAFTTLTSSNTTDSTTTATGAIQTLGGLGVAKSIFAGGIINIPATTSTAGQITQAGTRLVHTYGTQNLFLGSSSGNFTLTGAANVGVGRSTLIALTNGARNLAIGDGTMYQLTSGADNCGFGASALNAMISGSWNIGLGSLALVATTGNANIGIGYLAGQYNTTGGSNVFIGYNSGGSSGSVALSSCITLGVNTAITANSLSYCTVIGAEATSATSNSVTLGRATDTVRVPGGLVAVPEAIAPALNAAGTCSATITTTGFALNGVNALSLANGTNGQIKVISCTAVTAAGTATLTPTTSAADYSTIDFTAAGQTATLQYFTAGGWYILSVRGAVAA